MGKRFERFAAMACETTLLMLFNFVFWCTGVGMLIAGIMTRMELYNYVDMSVGGSGAALLGLACLGALVTLVATLACCCTVRGHPALLYVYGAFLAVIAALELAAGASAYAYRRSLADNLDQALNESLALYGTPAAKDSHVDAMQQLVSELDEFGSEEIERDRLHCCGNRGYSDWGELKPSKDIPASCCKETENCDPPSADNIWTEGCYTRIIDYINSHLGMVAACAIGLAFFPLIGVFLACCLASNINKTKYEQVA